MTDTTPTITPHERLQAAYERLHHRHHGLLNRLDQDLARLRAATPLPTPRETRLELATHHQLTAWATHALTTDIPLDELADALPYTGAGQDEAAALIEALTDRGWIIVPAPARER